MKTTQLICALDLEELPQIQALIEQLDPSLCKLKIGKGPFTRFGPALVKQLVDKGFDVFLDLKFHDIPNTVANACRAAADLGVWMMNIHASGGPHMMSAASEALQGFGEKRPLLVGVTVLTSFDDEELRQVGITRSLEEQVAHLARSAKKSGLDGVVCSANEALMLHETCGKAFCLVTPGIRLGGEASDDQKRVATVEQAKQLAVDYIVVGRPIYQAADPMQVVQEITQKLRR